MPEWVFGYGSLVSPAEAHEVSTLGAPRPAELRGFERSWNVAMANADPVNDGKHYVDPATGARPPIYVAYLNVSPVQGAACNGIVIPVDADTVVGFDRRELNYRRIDVTHSITPRVTGTVWTYTGTEGALERFRSGLAAGTVFVRDEYARYCRDAFEQRGPSALRRFDQTTRPPVCPSKSLVLRRVGDRARF